MRKMKSLLLAVIGLLCSISVSAQGFEVDGIYYKPMYSTDFSTVEVTYKGRTNAEYSDEYFGEIIIPESVNYDGKTFSVTSIGDETFCGCSGVTSVTIPNSVTSIGRFAFQNCSSLTSVTIPTNLTEIGDGTFWGCLNLTYLVFGSLKCSYGDTPFKDSPLRTIVTKVSVPTNSATFSNYTYIHAPLYVPEGAYWNYAYAKGWGDFIHIKEMATEVSGLQARKAYMIADSKGCNYKVYDAQMDAMKTVECTHALDEESENCCWTVMKENDNTYLYNLGAKKFGVVGNDGAITLSETPVSVTISEDENGLNINGTNCMFVLNKNIEVDVTGINDVLQNGVNTKNVQVHSLDGRRQQHLTRGINIVNGKKVLVK